MFHSILTILTLAAVAFHATLGCCAHHTHSCDSHEPGLAEADHVDANDHGSHGHHHHDDESDAPGREFSTGCGHEHDNGGHQDCHERDCSFTSVPRSNDLEWMLTFSILCQALGDEALVDEFDKLNSAHSVAESPPGPLSLARSARAKTQVWRL